jgi:tetratricopeptide (TPR) repeat protein
MVAEVLQENPRDSEALLMRGNIALAKPDLPAAIADLRTVLRDQPNSGRALRLLARAHQLNSEPELAKETLQRAVKASPRDIQTRLELAQSFAQGANLDSALEELQAVLDVSPVHLGALQAQIRIQMAKGDWRAAERIAQHIRSTYPDRPLGYHLMGLVYQAERKLDASTGEFELALERAPDAVEPLSALIESYLADKKPHKALARLDQAIEQTPTNSMAYNLKGQVLLVQKNSDQAEAAFRTASQLNPKWAPPYWNLGALHLVQGNNEEAIRVLQEGLKATSGNVRFLIQLATVYEMSGKHEQAIREYENLLARSPRSEPAANNLAMLLANYRQDGKSRDKALELARQFEASKNPLYVDTLGWVYYKHGRLDEAISLLSSAVANVPDHPILNYHLGMAYYAQGQMASARQHLEKAVAARQPFPGVDEAKNTLAVL